MRSRKRVPWWDVERLEKSACLVYVILKIVLLLHGHL